MSQLEQVLDISGEYFVDCKVAPTTPEAQNDADAERLWQASKAIAGLT